MNWIEGIAGLVVLSIIIDFVFGPLFFGDPPGILFQFIFEKSDFVTNIIVLILAIPISLGVCYIFARLEYQPELEMDPSIKDKVNQINKMMYGELYGENP